MSAGASRRYTAFAVTRARGERRTAESLNAVARCPRRVDPTPGSRVPNPESRIPSPQSLVPSPQSLVPQSAPVLPEQFTPDERARLAPYFTSLDGHVFALTNLPETVKGALFARYSRSAKSLRRLFLDEFADRIGEAAPDRSPAGGGAGIERAEKLYARV